MIVRILLSLIVAGGLVAPPPVGDDPVREPTVHVVRMVDKSATEYAFEPSEITAQPGDVVRFVQTGTMPHNVEFKEVAEGTELNGQMVGPYLTQPDETYELRIDERFGPGVHRFVCTPHEFMGMTGTLTVTSGN